jgi:hypothetical protein
LNKVVFSPLLSPGVGTVILLESIELVGVVFTEVVELLGSRVVEFDSLPLPSVMLGLGLGLVLVLRLGILDNVAAVVCPSSLLTPTKRVAAAR